MSHEWGNYPENFAPKMFWGARAILERRRGSRERELYLLPDRQCLEQMEGSRRDKGEFIDWINKMVLPDLRSLARKNFFREWEDMATIRSEDGSFICQATPKNSGGEYLYIGCWEVDRGNKDCVAVATEESSQESTGD